MLLHQKIKQLIEQNKKLDINKKYGIFGTTPLIVACANGDLEAVKIFFELGANINLSDNIGNTPLSTAIFNKKFDIAIYLLNNNANRYMKDIYGNITKELKNNVNYPKELLIILQDQCPICLDNITDIGYMYECGHSVHNNCKIDKCPYNCKN